MSGWHAAALVIVSVSVMQAFLSSIEIGKQGREFSADLFWRVFFRFTAAGYAIALVLSAYVLWTFGRLEGAALEEVVMSTIVLGFPAAVGASAARLIL
jgi:uncharacterized membrane protein